MVKKILLIDVDSTIPNIALMKISAWHKQQGDQVSWDAQDPDIVYASIIFTENRHKLYWLKSNYPNAEIKKGGSGYSFEDLPEEIDQMFPDYSIYKSKISYGMTTRGCPNKCKWCIVDKKEGKIRPYMKIEQFHDPKHKKVVLLDNNILALKGWFKENMNYVKKHNLKVDFNQGLDIRLLDQEIIDIIKGIRFQELRFAWDSMEVSEIVKDKLELITDNFYDEVFVQHKCTFYVLVECDTDMVDDLERVHYLRERNIPCYIMPYQKIYKEQPDPIRHKHTKSLERYCNKRDEYFRYKDYWEYLKKYYSLSYYLKIKAYYEKVKGEKHGV